jgi:GNAT superfamily N-acetyltransferase
VPSSEPGACPELEEYATNSLKEGMSLMAITPSKRILGVSINSTGHPTDLESLENLTHNCSNSKFKIIAGILTHMEKQSDIFNRFGVEKTFEMGILSVDRSCRGRGIGAALLERSIELARKLEYPLFHVDCTSAFTTRAVVKLGLQKVYSIRYDEYKPSPYDEPPLRPPSPHKEVASYVLTLK